jgi:UPF0755 protein
MKKFFITMVIITSLTAILFFFGNKLFKEYTTVEKGDIEIYEGASVKQIAVLLENYGNIKNADFFYYYIRLKLLFHDKVEKEPFNLMIKNGEYSIKEGNFESLISKLNSGPEPAKPAYVVTIPESSTVLDIANIFEKKKIFTKEDFLNYIQDEKIYKKYRNIYPWLPRINEHKLFLMEGYLQGNTYNLPANPTVEIAVDMMLEETDRWHKKHLEEINKSFMTFDEIITLASIVEAESKFSEDRPKVAQVFLNRLSRGMKLESDMTASYANQEHKVFMYYKDIETESPYNTYFVEDLPIGPINSPSKESLLGVIHPSGDKFKAIYFYARPSGETFFAENWEEHEINRLAWEHEWKELEEK